eukprot:m.165905 g.165905  ORF g.165905 m.165905 type:complete len:451 (+) comp24993_c0_seq3:1459-2811(+)
MADASVSCEGLLHNFWSAPLYMNWLRTMRDYQLMAPVDCAKSSPIFPDCNGTVADTIPHTPAGFPNGQRPADPSWGMAYPLIFNYLWQYHQDKSFVASFYPGIKQYVEYHRRVAAHNPSGLVLYHYYGDWLQPGKVASTDLIGNMSSAFNYALSIRIARDAAQALGLSEDYNSYSKLFQQVAVNFNNTFYHPDQKTFGDGTQAALTYALYLGFVSAELEDDIFQQVVTNILAHDTHLQTGILATKWLPEVLASYGRADLMVEVLLQRDYPGWGFMVLNNATTIWEHWENIVGDGMNSHSHPALGSIGAWLYRYVAGIRLNTSANAFDSTLHVVVEPAVINNPQLTGLSGSYETMYGPIGVSWSFMNDEPNPAALDYTVNLPVGVSATVCVPKPFSASSATIVEGNTVVWSDGKAQTLPPGLKTPSVTARQQVCFEAGAGAYSFTITSDEP